MNKYKEKANISWELIAKNRQEKDMSLEKLSNKLQLVGVTLYPNDLFLIEKGQRIVKDFEIVALCKVLDINIADIQKNFG